MVTPLLDRDTLDIEGLERLVEHILKGGVDGLFILGTTGEAPSLSYDLRRELIKRTCRTVAGRVPVLVGITDTCFIESVNLSNYAADCGADAVVLAPPYYFPVGQPELLEYLQHITESLALPVFLYNMPSHTKLCIEPDIVRKAAENSKIVGLKDSSADMIYFHHLQELFKDIPEFSLLVGPEELLAEALLFGGDGGVCGGANIYPQLYVNLYQAAKEKNLDQVAKLHSQVMQISSSIYSVGKYGSRFIKGTKCSLSLMNICSDFMAEPFHRFREPERELVREALQGLGLI